MIVVEMMVVVEIVVVSCDGVVMVCFCGGVVMEVVVVW